MIEHLHLLRPWWLLTLLPLGFIVWRLYRSDNINNNWRKVCDPQLLPYFLVTQATTKIRWPLWLLGTAWLSGVIALTGPAWSMQSQQVYRSLHGVVIVFDLSPQMFADDLKPSRVDRAKYKLMDLLSQVKGSAVGLVAFSGEAYTVSPLTQDARTITAMVDEMSPNIMPARGNNISAGLLLANKLLQHGAANPGSIILITDSSADAAAIKTARQLGADGVKINVLPIGTAAGAPIPLTGGSFLKDDSGNIILAKLDVNSLEQLAAANGGSVVPFTIDDTDVQQLLTFNDLGSHAVKTNEVELLWRDQGIWWVLLLVLLAALAFRRGWFEELSR